MCYGFFYLTLTVLLETAWHSSDRKQLTKRDRFNDYGLDVKFDFLDLDYPIAT